MTSASDTTHEKRPDNLNTSEQGDTANIKQNTTNKGFFRGRRMKWRREDKRRRLRSAERDVWQGP